MQLKIKGSLIAWELIDAILDKLLQLLSKFLLPLEHFPKMFRVHSEFIDTLDFPMAKINRDFTYIGCTETNLNFD
jgi:hypothetical protein